MRQLINSTTIPRKRSKGLKRSWEVKLGNEVKNGKVREDAMRRVRGGGAAKI